MKRYNISVSVKGIEAAITQLLAQEVAALMARLSDYHARLGDQQIEGDLEAGRLDAMLAEVDKEYQTFLSRPL